MIQIDDAGSGSLVGGTCIAALRVETNEYFYEIIPVEYYQGDSFKEKKYLNVCQDVVFELLKKLSIDKKEEIQICQGYMFDLARKKLKADGYNFQSSKIENPLQDRIEDTFKSYALDLGVPAQYVKYTRYPFHFHRILRWVYASYQERHKLCKTGWKSWQKYGNLDVVRYYDYLYKDNYTCLRCGQKINKGSKVKVLEYVSNCPNIIYLHDKC